MKCNELIDAIKSEPIIKIAEIYVPELKILVYSTTSREKISMLILDNIIDNNENKGNNFTECCDQNKIEEYPLDFYKDYKFNVIGKKSKLIEFNNLIEKNKSILNELRNYLSSNFDITKFI